MRNILREKPNHNKLHDEGMKCVRGEISHCSSQSLDQVEKRRKYYRERYEKLKKVFDDLITKVADGSAHRHEIICVFKHCHGSLKGLRRGTMRCLLKTDGDCWLESPTGHSTAHILLRELKDWICDLVAGFYKIHGTNYMSILELFQRKRGAFE